MHFEKQSSITQMPLHELKVGQHGIVVRVGGQGTVRRRIMDMGLVSGTEVKVVRAWHRWVTLLNLRSRDTTSAFARMRHQIS